MPYTAATQAALNTEPRTYQNRLPSLAWTDHFAVNSSFPDPSSGLTTHDEESQCLHPSFPHTATPLAPCSVFILVPIQSSPGHFLFFPPGAEILSQAPWPKARGVNDRKASLFEKQYLRGGLSEILCYLKFQRLNERNTRLTKRGTAKDASSALAKSCLSFHLFFPNNSCPLSPCYSAVKNKTSLRLSVFLFFPRVGLITGD